MMLMMVVADHGRWIINTELTPCAHFEHRTSKLHSPILLGETIQTRSFTAAGEINPLAKSPKPWNLLQSSSSETSNRTCWNCPSSRCSLGTSKSPFAVGWRIFDSVKWAFILLQIGDRCCSLPSCSRGFGPNKLDQLSQWQHLLGRWLWPCVQAARIQKRLQMHDWDRFAEYMSEQVGPQEDVG